MGYNLEEFRIRLHFKTSLDTKIPFDRGCVETKRGGQCPWPTTRGYAPFCLELLGTIIRAEVEGMIVVQRVLQ